MNEVILIKVGEIVLKGLNKRNFESQLIKNIRNRIKKYGEFEIKISQSTITISSLDEDSNIDDIFPEVKKVFGIARLSKAIVTQKSIDSIKETVKNSLGSTLTSVKTFKVESKRADKRFHMTSPQISEEVGGFILEQFPNLTVDVHNPDIVITVEIRTFNAFIRLGNEPGAGGLPVSSGGRAVLLISGGIDSPVAGFMMAKRGIALTAVHFASPPYTSARSEKKVIELVEKVSEYAGRIKLFVVPFTEIQERIKRYCPEELFTLIMRRMMMRISEKIALDGNCKALITGESLGQVASQTLQAISCTDAAVSMPVFRPLIGMDKDEIIAIARRIGTFDISIQPFEDCCTVFVPKHPKTKPNLSDIEGAENKFDWDELIKSAVINSKVIYIEQ